MKPLFKKTVLALVAASALGGGVALAQQPQPQPGQPGPGGVRPVRPQQPLPGGHPPVPGMQPGMPGRPGGMPGMPGGRPGRPGLPPGFDPSRMRPRPHAPAAHEEEHGGSAHHECPGHGPNDPPPHINLWHGIFTANKERAEKGGFLNQLLFRYENEKDPCDPKNEPPPLLASILNFGVVAFVVYRFGKKPLAEALSKRKQTIMADIDTATKLKEDAEARLEEYEEKLDNIQDKLAEVRAEYAAQAEIEKKHILAEAEERRVRMRKDAEFRIEQELKAARAELLREAVENAVAAAEELVQKQIAAKDHDKMASDYLASIGPSLSGAHS
ncbi:ATP synthase F0 sector subunit b [Minicystis rosea]|nr:ATP synthase F0 sector subunit b [Minicystis rosea]